MAYIHFKASSKRFLSLICCLFFTIIVQAQKNGSDNSLNFYTQGNSNRTAAEWEPAIGTMIVWPLCIPHKLAVEISKDNHLFTLVKDKAGKEEAGRWYQKWGIKDNNNTFVMAPQGVDAWWTRDWGPSAIFQPDGTMNLGDGKYIFSTPVSGKECADSLHFLYVDQDNQIIKTEVDDNATVPVGKALGIPILDLPYIITGGNVFTDGLGTAISTCILLNENNFFKVDEPTFRNLNDSLMGLHNYHIISNFEKTGIQHIDCFLKLLDEERMLVAEPPKDHELYQIYEQIIEDELKKLKTPYGRPYEILRIKTDRYSGEALAAYTNSIIVNKTIYVPLFQIEADKNALKSWEEAMPGYKVKGFDFALKDEPAISKEMLDHYKSGYGWNNGDALHCRTRAVWDADMVFISVKRLQAEVESLSEKMIYATIIDYSGKGLVKGQQKLHWRLKGAPIWNSVFLVEDGDKSHFKAEIPYSIKGKTVEYYVSAESHSGKKETQPRTAPDGTFQFRIQ